ncbi:uncharacterized protein QC763_206780 [Podospora pseudopauciseta]|uniref:Copper acquisition factor BIM1-like domain-containing protein n=2 Tax=Podospora TaxID=5144 RepID=A0ABR0HPJ1_9PEZI|nr:hypothetical protein QC763_206780 [Podospora pseudopauciseta]KAK4679736.1 hypothetical protein QC764_206780 [Podospora pseudoanserina]
MVRRFQQAVALVAATATGVLAASENMGPASFMWPPDRAWSEHTDNEGPCGSIHRVLERTKFPLSGGRIALTAQDDSYHAQMSISFHNDPQEQKDFGFVLNTTPITEIDPGHTCLTIPDPPSTIAPGTNATIQLMYIADFDRPENQTFYACADIQYVRAADFPQDTIPCFNATDSENDVPAPTATGLPTNLPGHGDNGPPLNTADPEPSSSSVPSNNNGNNNNNNNNNTPIESVKTGLSKGAIAGAVIGTILGVAAIIGLAFLFYRERQRKNRLIAQRDSGRGVPWVEDPPKKSNISADSVVLGTRL